MPDRSRFVVVDLETRSACDLRERGGYNYAVHPTTRLLTVAWWVDDEYHVWLPGVDEGGVPQVLLDQHLSGVTVHYGREFPDIPTDRPWVGHNSWGFDEPVWWEQAPLNKQPPRWEDSSALAAAAGLPMGLQQIGIRLWGEGKYAEGSNQLKKASKATSINDCEACDVPVGQVVLVARYNVQDVKLTLDLMNHLEDTLFLPAEERELQRCHREINARGCKLDTGLLSALYQLANEAVEDAVQQIAEETKGVFQSIADLRKRTRVIQWVRDMGFDFGDSLAREVVTTWIEAAKAGEEDHRGQEEPSDDPDRDPDTPAVVGRATNLQLVIRVLQLRQSALRITAGKLEAAGAKVSLDQMIRGLFAYYGAHTGRWSGRGMQVQNLPKPKDGVPVWKLICLYRKTGKLELRAVKRILEMEAARLEKAGRKLKYLPSADDAASALIRCLLIPMEAGEVLLAADLAAIEVRVLAWLAGEEELLRSFFTGTDPYIGFCKKVTGRVITKKDKERDMWKAGVLGLGFQLGNEARVTAYVATYGIDLADYGFTAAGFVDAYRSAYPKIAGEVAGEWNGRKYRRGGFWADLNEAAILTTSTGQETTVGRIKFRRHMGNLYCVLPSGRSIIYRNARIVSEFKWGKDRDGVVYSSPRWKSVRLHGGILAENIVQATASDFIRHAIVLMTRAGFKVVLHVHDEIVASARRDRLPEFMKLVTTLPPWADGFPLGAEGGAIPRYAKTPPKGRVWKEQAWLNGSRV